MAKTTKSNVYFLVLAQACFLAVSMSMITYAGLAGKMLTPEPALATLPVSLAIMTTALSTGFLSFVMGRTSRKTGFFIGLGAGLLGAFFSMAAVWLSMFWLLCLGCICIGIYVASAQYYRFFAMESVQASATARAASTVLMGGVLAAIFVPSVNQFFINAFQPDIYMGPFFFMMLAILCAAVPVSRLVSVKAKPVENADISEAASEDARPLLEIVRQKVLVAAILNGAASYAIMSSVMTATPLAMQVCGLGPEVSKFVIQGHVFGMFLPSLFTGRLIERFGVVKILFAGHFVFALSFIAAFSGIELVNFSVALILVGLGWNFCFVGATCLLVEAYKASERTKVQGLNETIVYSCQGLASLSAGAVLYYLGWAFVIEIGVVILALTILVTLWYGASLKRQADSKEQKC